MIKIIVFSLVLSFSLIVSDIFSQANWVWQNPLPQQNNLKSVFPIDSMNVVAVGDCGMIIRTSDGGNNWTIIQTADTNTLSSVFFINAYTGWIAGGNYTGNSPSSSSIYRTTNAGINWMRIDLGVPDNMLTSIFFLNSLTGFAGGGTYNSGRIFKTTNGGSNWTVMPYNFNGLINSLFFIDGSKGWAAYSNTICRTVDGGVNWILTTTNPGMQSSIYFTDSLNGFYACGTCRRTTNGGVNWSIISPFGISVRFANQSTGWIGGASSNPPEIFKTTNSGANWFSTNFQTSETVMAIDFKGCSTGWGVGWYGTIQKTTDGGDSWTDQLKGLVFNRTNAGCFINSNTGYIAGGEGYSGSVAKTTNGGTNWSTLFFSNTFFNSVSFVNQNYGWVCGYGYSSNILGKILNTTDGGINWNLQFSILIEEYTDVKFMNMNTGYVFGYNVMGGGGKIMKTTNGGLNWANTYVTGGCYKSFFLNENTGWVGCSGGHINMTTNAGLNWWLMNTSYSQDISSVYFVNMNTGFAGGLNGGLYRTTDGGTSWSGSRIALAMFNDINFINDQTGWAGTGAGELLYTTNQGNSWIWYPRMTYNGIRSVIFADQYTGWIIGGNGMVLKTTNGGGLIGVERTGESIPETFLLSQNYPNPFNPTTKINFAIPKQSFATLRIYNMLGEEVATLVNQQLKPGTYQANWDATNFASGVYFYVLQADDFIETKKMVLIK